jgi:hypothetical protein
VKRLSLPLVPYQPTTPVGTGITWRAVEPMCFDVPRVQF